MGIERLLADSESNLAAFYATTFPKEQLPPDDTGASLFQNGL